MTNKIQLVTLLSLKQREVNTESLINSKLQSQILVVFTAATVLFVIQCGFSPPDETHELTMSRRHYHGYPASWPSISKVLARKILFGV